jgi:hypothetical protein
MPPRENKYLYLYLYLYVHVHVHICRNAGMLDCPASGQSGTGLKKLTMPEQVRYRTKLTQSGIFLVWYQTKIRDAGMPMPAVVSSMPMRIYGYYACTRGLNEIYSYKERELQVKTKAKCEIKFLVCLNRNGKMVKIQQ